MITMEKLRCGSFFAGVGGIDIGFEGFGDKKSEFFEIVYANEYDPYSIKTYELNLSIKVDSRDVHKVTENIKGIPDFDVMLAGFPCQAFSIAGRRQGFEDEQGRGTLFFELTKIIKEKQPSIVFLENVKNLVGHNKGKTFSVIIDSLEKLGYFVRYKLLNAKDYGIPQNRERLYIVAFKNKENSKRFVFPAPVSLEISLSDILGFHSKVGEKYYYRKGKFKGDIYEKLVATVNTKDAVFQWRRHYVRKNMSGVVPTLTANMGMGGHNVPIIFTDYGIRKITSRECFNTQGFPKEFSLPDDIAESHLYKQAGNSVCVPVIAQIAKAIEQAVKG